MIFRRNWSIIERFTKLLPQLNILWGINGFDRHNWLDNQWFTRWNLFTDAAWPFNLKLHKRKKIYSRKCQNLNRLNRWNLQLDWICWVKWIKNFWRMMWKWNHYFRSDSHAILFLRSTYFRVYVSSHTLALWVWLVFKNWMRFKKIMLTNHL